MRPPPSIKRPVNADDAPGDDHAVDACAIYVASLRKHKLQHSEEMRMIEMYHE